jgi:hypothetical protein
MVTSEGEKQKPQLGPTITVTVTALAAVGHKAKNRAAITGAIARTDEVFIGSSHLVLLIVAHWILEFEAIHHRTQERKSDRIVTLRSSLLVRTRSGCRSAELDALRRVRSVRKWKA